MTRKKTKLQELEEKLTYAPKPAWEQWGEKERTAALRYSDEYKTFLDRGKTEREAVAQAVRLAKREGFAELAELGGLKSAAGKKLYVTSHRKNVALAVLGNQPLTAGINLIISHLDCPRLDLKGRPLYEDQGMALLRTQYYGGIKKYQWPSIPLALHGVVIRANGTRIQITVGEEADDPCFVIPDLEPHLSHKRQDEKKMKEAIAGEELNVLVGGLPLVEEGLKSKVKLAVLQHLFQRYGIVEEDFVSAELELVPAWKACDVGWDRSMVGGYGQDDRSAAYCALTALFGQKRPEHTCLAVLVDKEEIGSEGNTGAKASFLTELVSELLARTGSDSPCRDLPKVWRHTHAISGDVHPVINPIFKDVHELQNSATLGHGLILTKHTGSGGKYMASDASAEYMGTVRNLLNAAKVPWQFGLLGKVDEGGGGTVAKYLAAYGLEIVDAGPGLLGMHSPFEVAHKADLYAACLGFSAFFAHGR